MSDALWRGLCDQFRTWTGLTLSEWRRELVLINVQSLANDVGVASPEALLAAAATDAGEHLRDLLIARVSVGLTWFGRELGVLEAALDRARAHCARVGVDEVYVWSAGCSTGEEPYTLAMALLDRGLRPRILATDINREVLRRAARGRYPKAALGPVPERWRSRYFVDAGSDAVEIEAACRRTVSFARHNLASDPMPPDGWGRFDLVVCRNVLIYFDPIEAVAVARRLDGACRGTGQVVVGAVEQSLAAPPEPARPAGAPSRRRSPSAAPPGRRALAAVVLPNAASSSTSSSPSSSSSLSSSSSSLSSSSSSLSSSSSSLLSSSSSLSSSTWPSSSSATPSRSSPPLTAPPRSPPSTPELDAEVHLRRGIADKRADRLPAAIEHLRRARFLAADRWLAPYLLGLCLEAVGRPDEAREAYRHAIAAVAAGGHAGLPDAELDAATMATTVSGACYTRLAALGGAGAQPRRSEAR